jgi:hypothetical protein
MMAIQQVSVFIENREGRLAEVSRLLTARGVNIRALSLADTADFGVLRLIVNDPALCAETLKSAGLVARLTDVIALGLEDRPGGLDHVLSIFAENTINVEYMYAFAGKTEGKAFVVFKTKDTGIAEELAVAKGIPVLTDEALIKL